MCTWSFITTMSRLTVGLGCCWCWGAIMAEECRSGGWSNDTIQSIDIFDLGIFRQIVRIVFRRSKRGRVFGFWFRCVWFFGWRIFWKFLIFTTTTCITFLHIIITVDIHASQCIIYNGKIFQIQFARLLQTKRRQENRENKIVNKTAIERKLKWNKFGVHEHIGIWGGWVVQIFTFNVWLGPFGRILLPKFESVWRWWRPVVNAWCELKLFHKMFRRPSFSIELPPKPAIPLMPMPLPLPPLPPPPRLSFSRCMYWASSSQPI